jgi:hypothetical protein
MSEDRDERALRIRNAAKEFQDALNAALHAGLNVGLTPSRLKVLIEELEAELRHCEIKLRRPT